MENQKTKNEQHIKQALYERKRMFSTPDCFGHQVHQQLHLLALSITISNQVIPVQFPVAVHARHIYKNTSIVIIYVLKLHTL